jgi:hypothetical protein
VCEWYGGDETAEVYNEVERKARKPHKCDGCGGKIAVGEKYTYYSGIYDHEPFHGHACAECVAALSEFGERHDGGHPAFSQLEESLDECVREDGPTSWAIPYLEAMRARHVAANAVPV